VFEGAGTYVLFPVKDEMSRQNTTAGDRADLLNLFQAATCEEKSNYAEVEECRSKSPAGQG
jgi:hypothetical protein